MTLRPLDLDFGCLQCDCCVKHEIMQIFTILASLKAPGDGVTDFLLSKSLGLLFEAIHSFAAIRTLDL